VEREVGKTSLISTAYPDFEEIGTIRLEKGF